MVTHRKLAIVIIGGVAATACFGFARAAERPHTPAAQSDAAPTEPGRSSAAAPDAGATSAPESTPAVSPPSAGGPAAEATASLITLEVDAVGFDNDRGHAIAMLFRPGSNVLDKDEAFSKAKSELHGGAARLRFPPLEEGMYALVVFHDTNDNGEVDHNFFHLPSEQLGFSNGFRPGLFAGLPTFEKLQFRLERPPGSEPVTMRIVVK